MPANIHWTKHARFRADMRAEDRSIVTKAVRAKIEAEVWEIWWEPVFDGSVLKNIVVQGDDNTFALIRERDGEYRVLSVLTLDMVDLSIQTQKWFATEAGARSAMKGPAPSTATLRQSPFAKLNRTGGGTSEGP